MPNEGQPDAYWEDRAKRLALGEKLKGKGTAPKNQKWRNIFNKIKECPVTKRLLNGGRNQPTLRLPQCKCGYNHDPPEPPPAPTVAVAAAEVQRPRKQIDFGILKKPSPLKSINEVRDKCTIIKQDGCYDLLIFGYTDGKCPHCKGKPKETSVGRVVKTIYTKTTPRFVQGIGLCCTECRGRGWQSFEKTYVDTLPRSKQHKLDAIIVRKATGVGMDIIVDMRNGASAASIERKSRAYAARAHAALEFEYEEHCRKYTALGFDVEHRDFPELDLSLVAKADTSAAAFFRDYLTVRGSMLREMASIQSKHTMAMDHQHKVARHAAGEKACSFSVVGDYGLVLGYYIVPDEGEAWLKSAMLELVERHGATLDSDLKRTIIRGNLPKVIFVDKLCCGGVEGATSDAVRFFYGMLKKLDVFHLIQRIGHEMNSEHPRKCRFMKQISECIFTAVEADIVNLESARERAGITDLTPKEKKADKLKYVRTVIEDQKQIVSKILAVTKGHVALDRAAKLQSLKTGDKCENINTAHPAYPLITKKILKCIMNQCVHILNGCVHDEAEMNIKIGTAEYRGVLGVNLDVYKSLRGSGKVEALHAVADKKVYGINIMKRTIFDARLHWLVTHYNRARLRELGKDVPDDCVAYSEVGSSQMTPLVPTTSLRFGFGYYNHAVKEFDANVEDEVLDALDGGEELGLDVEIAITDDEGCDKNTDDESSEDDSVSYVDKSAIEDELKEMSTGDIPSSVDFTDLVTLEGMLAADVDWTTEHNPFAATNPLEDKSMKMACKSATFVECLENANKLAAEHGIDIEKHDFQSINEERFNECREVSGRRNAQSRRERSQQVDPVGPDFNKIMEAKFIVLWTESSNPGNGKTMLTWCREAKVKYDTWKTIEIQKAIMEKRPTPPLWDVNFEKLREWANKMMQITNAPKRAGAVDADSSELSEQIQTLATTSSPSEKLTYGGTADCSPQTVTVTTAATIDSITFEPPTTNVIQQEMPPRKRSSPSTNDGNDQQPKKKPRRKKVQDKEFEKRRQAAGELMERERIVADPVDSSNRRCTICWKNKGFKYKGIPHARTRIDGALFHFCPLADDHSIYHDLIENRKATKSLNNKRQYESMKPNE